VTCGIPTERSVSDARTPYSCTFSLENGQNADVLSRAFAILD